MSRPLLWIGALAAFVFAAQMLNFPIPGTGSSGHVVGGVLLAFLLGPQVAFLVLTAVLTVQALLFSDGGLLALGANVFNMAVMSCLVAYPMLERLGFRRMGRWGTAVMAAIACVVGLQWGALGVVLQTQASGITALPVSEFLGAMLPIHLAIGVIEGLLTAALVAYLRDSQPALLHATAMPVAAPVPQRWIVGTAVAAGLMAGVFSWFASGLPDGLEWSIARTERPGSAMTAVSPVHERLQAVQESSALFPDYRWPALDDKAQGLDSRDAQPWAVVDPSTSFAGLAGALATLLLGAGIGWVARRPMARPLLNS